MKAEEAKRFETQLKYINGGLNCILSLPSLSLDLSKPEILFRLVHFSLSLSTHTQSSAEEINHLNMQIDFPQESQN